MKAKDLAAILLTVPEWDVTMTDMNGEACHVEVERNTIDPRCKYGHVQLYDGELVNPED